MARARDGLPRLRRLRAPTDFATTLKSRWRERDDIFGVFVLPNAYPYGRLGIVVSRKVSIRAVVRNRVKRQIREAYRRTRERFSGLDLVVVASPKAGASPSAALRTSLEKLWDKVEKQCRKS